LKLASELIEFLGSEQNKLLAEAWGEPDAAPVILLHGAGQTRYAWGVTARALANAGWRAYALDMRGHGDSDWHPQGHYALGHYVADLLAVCRQIEQKPALVGASRGGLTALLSSGVAESPVFSSFKLVDVTPRLETSGVQRILKFMRAHLDGFADLDEALTSIADYLPERKPTTGKSGLLKNLRRHRDGRYYWHWDPRLLDHIGHIDSDQVRLMLEAAAQLTIPTLIVRGRMSDVVSESAVRELLARVPHARYVDVKGAGHMVAGDRNDVFSESVCEFLTAAAVSSGSN
jgi:pimeloyl-ACP methyl ester carboxylesterase